MGGETFSSEDANSWGLVTELVPASQVHGVAMQRAVQLADKPICSIVAIKDWLYPRALVHQRIDDEIGTINTMLSARRSLPRGDKST